MRSDSGMIADPTGVSRRQCLAGLAGAGASLLAPSVLSAQEKPDPRIARLVRDTIGIDAHNHVDVAIMPDVLPQPDIDIAGALKRSGLTAVCLAFALDYQKMTDPSDGYRRFVNGLNSTDQQLKRNGMTRALTAADVRRAHRDRRPTVIQSVEGSHWLEGKVERLQEGYARGLRHLGLLHDNDAVPPLGDTNTKPAGLGGLTPLGADVIRECNQLGILIDLAHASEETTYAALKISRTPMLFSHTGLNTRLDYDPEVAKVLYGKLVSKEQASAIARAGGVVGVWKHVSMTPEQYGNNVRAMADVCGIDHVCIGTDSKLTPALGLGGGAGQVPNRRSIGGPTDTLWPDMPFGFYYAVVSGLLKAGFRDTDIAKIGGENYLRVFEAATTNRA